MSTDDRKPLPPTDEETDIRPPPPPKPSDVETVLDTSVDPMATPLLGADLSAQLAAQAEDTEVETMVADADAAAKLREEARVRALPAPPHPSADQALKTKDQVAAEEEAAVQALLKGEEPPEPKPPEARPKGEVAEPADLALQVMGGLQGLWNIVSGTGMMIGVITIPLGIAAWILAFFELRLAWQSREMSRSEHAAAAKRLSYWEMGALIYALSPVTAVIGFIIWLRARSLD